MYPHPILVEPAYAGGQDQGLAMPGQDKAALTLTRDLHDLRLAEPFGRSGRSRR
jgi:hypothetical protein